MSVSFIIFIVIQIVTLAYFVESLRRTAIRVREYPLEETHETLPFRGVRLRHIIILYIVCYLAWVGLSFWLYITFVDPSLLSFSETNIPSNVILDL